MARQVDERFKITLKTVGALATQTRLALPPEGEGGSAERRVCLSRSVAPRCRAGLRAFRFGALGALSLSRSGERHRRTTSLW